MSRIGLGRGEGARPSDPERGNAGIQPAKRQLAAELDARKQQISSQLAQAQLSLEQYLAEAEEGQTEEEFWSDVEERSTQALKAQLVLDKVAEERSVEVDQNDLTQHILRKAQAEGTPPQQIADHLQEHPHHIEEYMLEIRRGKALASIVEAATITDSDGNPVQLAGLQEDGSLATAEPEATDDTVEVDVTADDVLEGDSAEAQQRD